MHPEIVQHLRRLFGALAHNVRRTEELGPHPARDAEAVAYAWALDELSAIYPAEHAEAERRHEDSMRRRNGGSR